MADNSAVKQFFKDASPDEAQRMYEWVQAAMEVRGLIQLPGTRKRRSDAGKPRGDEQPSLTGLPDEDTK